MNEKLVKFVDIFRDRACVFSVGCGRGEMLELLSASGIRCVGHDSDFKNILACRNAGHTTIESKPADALALLPAGYFDGVYIDGVLERMKIHDVKELISTCGRRIRRGGKIVISTANSKSLGVMLDSVWDKSEYARPINSFAIVEMLVGAGFSIVRVEPDEDTRKHGLLRTLIRMVRTVIVGPFFGPPEIYIYGVYK